MPTADSSGWTVAVTHPDTGRVRKPDVLDTQDAPIFNPGLNDQPRVRIPVRKDDAWLDPVYDDDPEMQVWRGGDKLPIDVLRDVERDTNRVVLVGVGGVELEKRVQKYYDVKRRHLAAEDLITTETSYAADVDAPQVSSDRQLVQTLDSTADFENNLSTADTDPVRAVNGTARPAQTNHVRPVYTITDVGGSFSLPTGDDFVGGEGFRFVDEGGYIQYDFTTNYDIPAGSLYAGFRGREPTDEGTVTIKITVDGASEFTGESGPEFFWENNPFRDKRLPAGDHTVRFEYDSSSPSVSPEAEVDVLTIYDDRFTYDFPDKLTDPGGHLVGPQKYPVTTEVPTEDFASQFAVVGGEADAVVDTADPAGKLQLSNDSGENYSPTNGDELDTNNVTVDFADDGSSVRSRVGLDRYGSRTGNTPKTGYEAQALDKIDIYADILRLYLLLDEDRDESIADILTFLTAETRYLWNYQLDANGDPTVVFTQPRQRVADDAPAVDKAEIQKEGDTFPRVTVKGSPRQVDGERFTASTTFTSLNESAIIGGSESVSDPDTGEQFTRGVDYELDRETGAIRVTNESALTTGDEYAISYRAEVQGTYTADDAPANPRELVRDVSGVTSEQQAEQAAFVLVDDLAKPRYAGRIRIPRSEEGFDPTQAVPLEGFGLPDTAIPLEVESDPEVTERGLQLRLGTRSPVEEALSRVRSQLSSVTKRT